LFEALDAVAEEIPLSGNRRAFRVLIVDDGEALRKVLCNALRARFPEIDVVEAGNCAEAWQQVDHCVPDLLLADIGLPGPSGLSLARELRALHPNVTITIFSHHDAPEYRQEAVRSGVDTFISKASSGSADVMAVVQDLMAAKGHNRERAAR
jgi:DNA-binding NarL/FixJ family response regulator